MSFERVLKWISVLGLGSVPVGPLFYFGFEVYLDVYGRLAQVMSSGAAGWLAGLLGLLAGIGLECVGIVSGHMTITFWDKGQIKYLLAAVASGVFYIVVGLLQLAEEGQGLALGQTLFLIALPTYVLAGLIAQNERSNAHLIAQNEQAAAQNEQAAEHQRQLEIMAAEAQAQSKLVEARAKAEAKVATAQAKLAAAQQVKMSTADAQNERSSEQFGKRRNELNLTDWQQIAQLSSAQVVEVFGTSSSTARRWRAEAADEIKIRANGSGGG